MYQNLRTIVLLWLLYMQLKFVPEENFLMITWKADACVYKSDFRLVNKNICGTVCCALGWGCTNPIFKYLGLKFSCSRPAYKEYRDYEAAENFFRISSDEAYWLFGSVSYDDEDTINTTIAEVRHRIWQLIRHYNITNSPTTKREREQYAYYPR